jgi:hypothetical protein
MLRGNVEDIFMRARLQALLLIVSLGLAGGSAALAAPPGTGGQGLDASSLQALVEPVQYWGSSYCDRLRRACQYKEYRGEVGEGNCRRYRQECGGGNSYCQRLRRACLYKEYRGEVGEGNCRRYRAECGGD